MIIGALECPLLDVVLESFEIEVPPPSPFSVGSKPIISTTFVSNVLNKFITSHSLYLSLQKGCRDKDDKVLENAFYILTLRGINGRPGGAPQVT